MHIKKNLKNCRHAFSTIWHQLSSMYHPARGQKKLLPACGVHYEVCMPSWHACFHLFCNIWFSNEELHGHSLRCSTSQGLNTKVAHKIFILWSFREFPGLTFPLMGPYCLILATLKNKQQTLMHREAMAKSCGEIPYPSGVLDAIPSSLRRQVILIKVNGFLVAKISKT